MSIGLILYRLISECLGWFAPLIFKRRVRRGKEHPDWVSSRVARKLPARPEGALIWLHGASIGECLLNLALAHRISENTVQPTTFLFTSQTLTAAQRLRAEFTQARSEHISFLHQMAPLDAAAISTRFLNHWKPDIAIFSEGEIWPHLLLGLQGRGIPTYLINARMTAGTLSNWARFPRTASRVFASFTHILASDPNTQRGLQALTKTPVQLSGNLKSALPVPADNSQELQAWQTALDGKCVLLAASTHAPEEADLVRVWQTLSPRPNLIIAPRHPERGEQLQTELSALGLSVKRRSQGATAATACDIYLADTIGEMGLWYRLCDWVYLGGGHAPNIGGHNPLEALQLGKPVLTGPSLYNFETMSAELHPLSGFTILPRIADLGEHIPADPVSEALSQKLARDAQAPMEKTLACLSPVLQKIGVWP